MHITKLNIILRRNENGVYICPNALYVAYSYPAKPAIYYKFLTVIKKYDINIIKPIIVNITIIEVIKSDIVV